MPANRRFNHDRIIINVYKICQNRKNITYGRLMKNKNIFRWLFNFHTYFALRSKRRWIFNSWAFRGTQISSNNISVRLMISCRRTAKFVTLQLTPSTDRNSENFSMNVLRSSLIKQSIKPQNVNEWSKKFMAME